MSERIKKIHEAFHIFQMSKVWEKKGFLSAESAAAIRGKYEAGFYSPNIFIRVLLFIFTAILAIVSLLFFGLLTFSGDLGEVGYGVLLLLFAGVALFFLEVFIISEKKAFRAGMDDALTYFSLGAIIGAISLFVYEGINENQLLVTLILSFPVIAVFAIRYIDMLLSAMAYGCFFYIVFLVAHESGAFAIIPFVVMILSAGVYYLKKQMEQKEILLWWKNCLSVVEILSLITFYLSGNYYVVRELTESLMKISVEAGADIPFAFFFYLFTILIPLLYIFLSLKNKDRIMLRTGLLLVAMAVFTFKYYFSLGHHEITLTLGGMSLLAAAYLGMRYLKNPKHGLTTKEEVGDEFVDSEAEALVMAESFKGLVKDEDKFGFGGGEFGGGGAGAKF